MSKCVKCGNEILTGDIHWEMGLCNNCYNELYKDHKTHISLDKMWLKLAQDFRDENEKLQDKVADLEAKLAEKERQLKLAEELLIKQEKEYDEQLEKQAKIHYKHLKEKDQDKILFAIDKLEKVKENAWQSATDISCLLDYTELAKIIVNQIKQLKEVK